MIAETISSDLKAALRRMRLSPMLETLPERITLARQNKMPYQDFLELVISDEISRRDRISTDLRAKAGKLDPAMRNLSSQMRHLFSNCSVSPPSLAR